MVVQNFYIRTFRNKILQSGALYIWTRVQEIEFVSIITMQDWQYPLSLTVRVMSLNPYLTENNRLCPQEQCRPRQTCTLSWSALFTIPSNIFQQEPLLLVNFTIKNERWTSAFKIYSGLDKETCWSGVSVKAILAAK